MAKLYAELTSDKGGRVASKSADVRLVLNVYQNNRVIGTLKVYPITDQPNGHRVAWTTFNGPEQLIQNTDDIPR